MDREIKKSFIERMSDAQFGRLRKVLVTSCPRKLCADCPHYKLGICTEATIRMVKDRIKKEIDSGKKQIHNQS